MSVLHFQTQNHDLMFSGSKHCPCCGEKAVQPQIIAEEKVKASPSANLLVGA